MKECILRWAAAVALVATLGASRTNADYIGITYADVPVGSSIDLTAQGNLDWAKWGNGETSGTTYATPRMTGGSIIQPALSPLGSVPSGQTVVLLPFPGQTGVSPKFSWTNGTQAMFGGNPVDTSVSETIDPAQSSYPLGLGLSFQAAASSNPYLLSIYVVGFNTRMRLEASLSGGLSSSLLASNAALETVTGAGTKNYFSFGRFDVNFAGAGETLTLRLTADNQSGIPTDATQYVYRNAGAFAATVTQGHVVPEPSSICLVAIGFVGICGWRAGRRLAR